MCLGVKQVKPVRSHLSGLRDQGERLGIGGGRLDWVMYL